MEHVEFFCESLVILVRGKTVLSGNLKEIKDNYRKKNISIIGDVDTEELKKIKGVNKVTSNQSEIIVSIEDKSYVNDVFKYVSKCKNIVKFVVEEPTLNEIFIDKVGAVYDK